MPGPVLITGCSSGIGRATALRLVAAGHVRAQFDLAWASPGAPVAR